MVCDEDHSLRGAVTLPNIGDPTEEEDHLP